MDDEGAKKVIAAILRLTNKVDSLDRMTVEAAAVANEGRQASMDAAAATNPKQIADHLARSVVPVMSEFDERFKASIADMRSGLALVANNLDSSAKWVCASQRQNANFAAEEDKRNRTIRRLTIGLGVSTVLAVLLAAWATHGYVIHARWGCELLGGLFHWGTAGSGSGGVCVFDIRSY